MAPDPDPGIAALPQDHVYPSNSHAGWAITALIAGSAGDTVDDALYYAGYVGAVGEFIGSAVIEPYDWFLTAKEIVNDPTSPYSYAGFIPFIPAGGQGLAEPVTSTSVTRGTHLRMLNAGLRIDIFWTRSQTLEIRYCYPSQRQKSGQIRTLRKKFSI